ncbi:MAG: NUDIX domain-containing protein [Pirellulaceae bacterium]|nr:NUDIX domain-containing protein [Planctomycetales bacterium]
MAPSYRPPTASPNAQVFAAGYLIVRDSEIGPELLLMRHADRWDLPKGHLEPGETFREGAARELFEETGIPLSEIAIDSDFEFAIEYDVREKRDAHRLKRKEVRIYLAWLTNPDRSIAISEHQGHAWVAWSPDLRIQPQTIDPLLNALARHWNGSPHPPRPDRDEPPA